MMTEQMFLTRLRNAHAAIIDVAFMQQPHPGYIEATIFLRSMNEDVGGALGAAKRVGQELIPLGMVLKVEPFFLREDWPRIHNELLHARELERRKPTSETPERAALARSAAFLGRLNLQDHRVDEQRECASVLRAAMKALQPNRKELAHEITVTLPPAKQIDVKVKPSSDGKSPKRLEVTYHDISAYLIDHNGYRLDLKPKR